MSHFIDYYSEVPSHNCYLFFTRVKREARPADSAFMLLINGSMIFTNPLAVSTEEAAMGGIVGIGMD